MTLEEAISQFRYAEETCANENKWSECLYNAQIAEFLERLQVLEKANKYEV